MKEKTSLTKLSKEQNLQKWQAVVAECRSSGETVQKWCKERNIPLSTYYLRQKKVFDSVANDIDGFAEIPQKTSVFTETREIVATIRKEDVEIDVYADTSSQKISELLRILKQC
ncbi:MAG: hypothetical protein DBX59_04980 [Bacillota bacterium]|nr:MAG: hypothetical protein DBX59_04980 [Bacillota bacterium]